jgi:hypothetical protein
MGERRLGPPRQEWDPPRNGQRRQEVVMTDYGHALQFGAFLTPSNQSPRDVVELAVTCERAGLDLVTFQDHPY